jgi:hypothetical protein
VTGVTREGVLQRLKCRGTTSVLLAGQGDAVDLAAAKAPGIVRRNPPHYCKMADFLFQQGSILDGSHGLLCGVARAQGIIKQLKCHRRDASTPKNVTNLAGSILAGCLLSESRRALDFNEGEAARHHFPSTSELSAIRRSNVMSPITSTKSPMRSSTTDRYQFGAS